MEEVPNFESLDEAKYRGGAPIGALMLCKLSPTASDRTTTPQSYLASERQLSRPTDLPKPEGQLSRPTDLPKPEGVFPRFLGVQETSEAAF